MFDRILCAVDLEPGSEDVIRCAGRIAERCEGTLRVVFVADSALLNLKGSVGRLELPEEQAAAIEQVSLLLREKAAVLLKNLCDALKTDVEPMVLEGSPVASRILEHVESWGADLLVVGSHGRRRLKRLLVGSVCNRLVHSANVPVLVVKTKEA